jgi:coenzyme F420-0:L-glutamate ligase/coenzyme F420-1:gamma-L-glutamate ligase
VISLRAKRYQIIPVSGIPLINLGDDLSEILLNAMNSVESGIQAEDILVVAHTIVSIAENRVYDGKTVEISDETRRLANLTKAPLAKVALALEEAESIIRESPVLITRTSQGIITDYSGVDSSNAPPGHYLKLPEDPGKSALALHNSLSDGLGFHLPVIIADTQGRPWRRAATNIAIGVAGMNPFVFNSGKEDLYGRELSASTVCIADELAAAAELVMGQANEGIPATIIRGVEYEKIDGIAPTITRDPKQSLFP